MTSRREFIQQTAGLTIACATGTAANLFGAPLAAAVAMTSPAGGWYDRPMRWAQIAFTEDDPGNYDPKFWLDYLQRLHVDAVTLSAGGVVAFYPTQIPMHYRSKWLGNWKKQEEFILRIPAEGKVYEFPIKLPPKLGELLLRERN